MGKTLLFLISFLIWNDVVSSHGIRRRSHLNHEKIIEVIQNDIDNIKKITHSKHKDICKGEAICVPPVQCPAHFYSNTTVSCKIIGGRKGVCCTTGHNHTERLNEKTRGHSVIKIDPITLGAITRKSRTEVEDIRTREAILLSSENEVILKPGSASYSHFRNSRAFNMVDLSDVMGVAAKALEIAVATRAFKNRQGLSNQQLEFNLVQEDLRPTSLGSSCAPIPACSPEAEKYRRIDGACNNFDHPTWGAPLTPYSRLLPPSYHDGIWAPRRSVVNGENLPSPRAISTALISDIDRPNPEFTLLLMQFGQFFSHEITQSIDASFVNGSAISCCSGDGKRMLPPVLSHHTCMPIYIPQEDEFFGTFKQGCMNFVRSVLAPREDCTLGYAEQMNKITHYIDGSSIYGSTPEQTGELRSFEGGRLEVFNDFGRDLLPLSKDPDACLTMEQGSACFTSGDTRTNQMISLVVVHTLFLREHNRVAGILEKLNPYWDDHKLFLETRQILIAELQVIVYKEFLPAVIGDLAMEEFQLRLQDSGYSYDYSEIVDSAVTNEFGTAAFRFGHSTVDGILKIYGPKKMDEMISIPEVMFHPSRMRKRLFLDEMLSTLTTEPLQEVDSSLSDALTKYMFRAGNPFGVDLVSLNIQRGRDHGLRPYNDYRELTGLPRIKSFDEYPPEVASKLKSVYASVDDMDLWIGGLLEEKAPGSLVGLTFRDIIADQFARSKKGDRYFFDLDPSINPGHFTEAQLQEVRKASMSRLICDNSDGILLGRQALNAFKKPGVPGNEFIECESSEIPRINLEHWKEA